MSIAGVYSPTSNASDTRLVDFCQPHLTIWVLRAKQGCAKEGVCSSLFTCFLASCGYRSPHHRSLDVTTSTNVTMGPTDTFLTGFHNHSEIGGAMMKGQVMLSTASWKHDNAVSSWSFPVLHSLDVTGMRTTHWLTPGCKMRKMHCIGQFGFAHARVTLLPVALCCILWNEQWISLTHINHK